MGTLRALARRAHHGAVRASAAVGERGSHDGPLPHPPIIIVGAPRSGTTLLQQALVAGLDVGWFSGWHNVAAGTPAVISNRRLGEPATHFNSDHGRHDSLAEPHEAASWWYRFFPRDRHALTLADVDADRLRALRRSMAATLRRAGRPVTWKNVVNSVRLEPLLAAAPEAVIVEIRRDLGPTAASILRARESQAGSVDMWWSVEPADIDSLRHRRPDQQVEGQIRGVWRALDAARDSHPGVPWIRVEHHELLASPRDIVREVGATLEAVTGDARLRPESGVPERFAGRTPQPTS